MKYTDWRCHGALGSPETARLSSRTAAAMEMEKELILDMMILVGVTDGDADVKPWSTAALGRRRGRWR
jgi:hypothetical protein